MVPSMEERAEEILEGGEEDSTGVVGMDVYGWVGLEPGKRLLVPGYCNSEHRAYLSIGAPNF
jgi:hypothetical protein